MRTDCIAVARRVSLSGAVLLAACVQSPEPSIDTADARPTAVATASGSPPENVDEARQAIFDPSIFHFVVVVADDGKEMSGGWQHASAMLKFSDWRHPFAPRFWSCSVGVGMPLRSEVDGRISATQAALITADIATDASIEVMHSQPDWLGEDYCIAFRTKVRQMFGARFPLLGARVTQR